MREVRIDGDEALERRYRSAIPVVTVEGEEVSRGRLDLGAVRRSLLAAQKAR